MRAGAWGLCAALATASGVLHAEPQRVRGDADIGFRTTSDSAGHRQSLALDLDARILMTPVANRFGPAAGIDTQLGVARPLAFVYGVHLSPLGLGFALGQMGYVLATIGIGLGGLTDTRPIDVEVPLAARIALDVSSRVRMIFDARTTFTDEARGGAWIGDETRFGTGVRIGRAWKHDAGGYYFRLDRVERQNVTFYALALGYELGGAI